jgi:hypothetical protein
MTYRVLITTAADQPFAHAGYLHNAGTPIDFDTVEEARAAAVAYAADYGRPCDLIEIECVREVKTMTPAEFFAAAADAGLVF